MNDLISRAVQLFRKGDDNRFAYAEVAAQIVGKRDGGTEELARQLRYKDVSTIEGHAKAGRLVNEMLAKMPKRGEIFRDSLYFSFWVEAGKVFYRKDSIWGLGDVSDWFDKAISEHQTIEVFRASLPRAHAEKTYFEKLMKITKGIREDLIDTEFSFPFPSSRDLEVQAAEVRMSAIALLGQADKLKEMVVKQMNDSELIPIKAE